MVLHSDAEKEKAKGSFGYTDGHLYRFMFEYAKPYKKELSIVLVYMLILAGVTAVTPVILLTAIDRFSANANILLGIGWLDAVTKWLTNAGQYMLPQIDVIWIEVAVLSLYYFLLETVILLISYKMRYLMGTVGLSAVIQMREEIFEHLQELDMGYHDRNEVGRTMSRITSDVSAINQFIGGSIVQNLVNLVTVVMVLIVMFNINVGLSFISISMIVPVLVLSRIAKRYSRPRRKEARRTNAILMANLAESIAGIKVTKGLNREPENKQKFTKINADRMGAVIRAMDVNATFFPSMLYLSSLAVGVIFYFGGMEIMSGAITVGVLFAFFNYNTILFRPVVVLGNFYEQIQDALTGAERVCALLDTKTTVPYSEDLPDLPPIDGEVEFRNITFEYLKDQPIYTRFNLHVPRGIKVALVGHTGAGKTTIINILSRLYNYRSGTLLIDGHDIKQYNLPSYRRQIASVPQDFFLFSSSIRDNLKMGDPCATDEQIWNALEKVGLAHFIRRLPEGLDTPLQERGGRLSIGQRQLVVFAAVLLANPRIVVLDEATSSIDVFTELQIQEAMNLILRDRTSFIIAHRLSTIKDADLICVIEDGEIIEQGTHDDLLLLEGHYFALVQNQITLADKAIAD